jgi:UDP-2,3-diacylglucosamine pyrophosphatase LpxH
MHYVIVSDLHLGAGDEREDFLAWGERTQGPPPSQRAAASARLDAAFTRFLAAQRDAAHEAGLVPHLLLLGDVVDLWQVRRAGEPWAFALIRILQAHPGFVAAVRGWIAAGGMVTWVVGNHDQPVVDPAAWALVQEIFSTINGHAGGAPVHHFADPDAGLYAEHGHQWDPFNRLVKLQKPDADCLGFRIVRLLVNQLEPHFPLIDKGTDVAALLELAWEAGKRVTIPGFEELAPQVVRWIGRASRPAGALLHELERFLSARTRPDFRRVGVEYDQASLRGMGRALEGKVDALIGALPGNFRFLASGHTHRAELREVRTRRHGSVMVLNPGTWRPVARVERRDGHASLQVVQQPGAVVLSPAGGAWEARAVEAIVDREAPGSAP